MCVHAGLQVVRSALQTIAKSRNRKLVISAREAYILPETWELGARICAFPELLNHEER